MLPWGNITIVTAESELLYFSFPFPSFNSNFESCLCLHKSLGFWGYTQLKMCCKWTLGMNFIGITLKFWHYRGKTKIHSTQKCTRHYYLHVKHYLNAVCLETALQCKSKWNWFPCLLYSYVKIISSQNHALIYGLLSSYALSY